MNICPRCESSKILLRSDGMGVCWNCNKIIKLSRINRWILKRKSKK